MDTSEAAGAETVRRQVKRAQGLMKEALRGLAALTEDQTVLGVLRVHDHDTAERARELISLGVGRVGAVDVVVIARPQGRAHNPTTAADAAKEHSHEGRPAAP